MFNIQLFVLNKSKYYINDNTKESQYLTKKQIKYETLAPNLQTLKIIQQFNEKNIKITVML